MKRLLLSLLLACLCAGSVKANLPGIQPVVVAGCGSITSLTYTTHTTSTAATIAAPATVLAGDLLVLVQFAGGNNGNPTANSTPSGFTDIPTSPAGIRTRIALAYKIAVGTEDGATITGIDDFIDKKILIQYRGDCPIASLTAAALVTQATGNNPAAQTIDASAGTAPVLGITVFAGQDGNVVSPRTTSITPDHEITTDNAFYVHDYVQDASPADYTFDMDDEGQSNVLAGTYIHDFQP